MLVVMLRTEPEEHIDRWYMITVQPTLLDPFAVICTYGNRQTDWQQIRILPTESAVAARDLAETIKQQKLKRGYQIVSLTT